MLGKDLRVFSEQYSVGGGGISRDNLRCFSGLDNLSRFSSVAAMTARARLLVVGEGVLAMGVGGSDAMKSAVGPRANGDPRIVGRRPDVTRRYAVSSCFGLDEARGLKCSGTKDRQLRDWISGEPVGTRRGGDELGARRRKSVSAGVCECVGPRCPDGDQMGRCAPSKAQCRFRLLTKFNPPG